jgi:hypothetical protein
MRKFISVIGMMIFFLVVAGCSAKVGQPEAPRSEDILAINEIVQTMQESQKAQDLQNKQAFMALANAQKEQDLQDRQLILDAAKLASTSNDSGNVPIMFVFAMGIIAMVGVFTAFIWRGGTIHVPTQEERRLLAGTASFQYLPPPEQGYLEIESRKKRITMEEF